MRFFVLSAGRRAACAAAFALAFVTCVARGTAQTPTAPDSSHAATDTSRDGALHLTIHDVGLAIGNARYVDGIRLNFRDSGHYVVHGLNATIWTPYQHSDGLVQGLALGLPLTGARRIDGVGLGIGLGADDDLSGVAVGLLGAGAGKSVHGILVGGLGAGSGSDVEGLAAGGLGVGAGQDVKGVIIGGLGVGAGHDVTGVSVAGLGSGAGNRVRGLSVAGLGVGAGESLDGISIAGVGVGAGQSVRGLTLAGVGVGAGDNIVGITFAGLGVGAGNRVKGLTVAGIAVGAGGSIEGITLAGLAVGAPKVHGFVASLVAGGNYVKGGVIAPAWMRISREGSFTGFSLSAFNQVKGTQHGLALGIFNFARELHGVQIGLLNYAGNNSGLAKLLPLVNAHH